MQRRQPRSERRLRVTVEELSAVAVGWSAQKQILGKVLQERDGRFILPGATKEVVKALPKSEYAR